MSDDDEDKCHCRHMDRVLHDFRRIERAAWILFAAIVGILLKEAWSMMTFHVRSDLPAVHSGERLAPDRVDEPTR